MPLVEHCLHLFAWNIHADLYNKASFVVSVVGNIMWEFMLHVHHSVPRLLKLAFG